MTSALTLDPKNDPFVNINGDSSRSLIEQNLNVHQKLQEAIDAMRQATPHGRNYPGSSSLQDARTEHLEIQVALHKLSSEYLRRAERINNRED